VDRVVAAAGLSKGTFYFNFESKEDLFFALVEERIDRPIRDFLEVLATAPAEEDMSAAVGGIFAEVISRERDVVLLDHEYWSIAARDPKVRRRYAQRQAALRDALATALRARQEELGAPEFDTPLEEVATAYMALIGGLSMERLTDPDAVPEHLLGEMFALIYGGLVARAERGG
jgi:AcrR family transcriptional regulator